MKFKNTLRNKLLFLWVTICIISTLFALLISIDTSWGEGFANVLGTLIFTSPPLIIQLIYNYVFRE